MPVELALDSVMSDEASEQRRERWKIVLVKKADWDTKVRVQKAAKQVMVGAGARVLFYPTLLYNVIRNKLQAEFRWWDQVDQVLESYMVYREQNAVGNHRSMVEFSSVQSLMCDLISGWHISFSAGGYGDFELFLIHLPL